MEIIRGQEERVRFTVPSSVDTATYKVFRGTEQIGGALNADILHGVASATIPYAAVREEGIVRVDLSFQHEARNYTDSKEVEVVTPILEVYDILDIHPQAVPAEIVAIEAAVRHIINAHTGQTFGFYQGVKEVKGTGKDLLLLPGRLLEMRTVNGLPAERYFSIESSGYAIKHHFYGVPPLKADYDGYHMHTGGVIHNPNNVKLQSFPAHATYKIDGDWGWKQTPDAVREAAKLLVNDYACGDAAYRDRYLTSMTAADWRIQFHSGAFHKTGNVRADQLLSDYVLKHGWAVL